MGQKNKNGLEGLLGNRKAEENGRLCYIGQILSRLSLFRPFTKEGEEISGVGGEKALFVVDNKGLDRQFYFWDLDNY